MKKYLNVGYIIFIKLSLGILLFSLLFIVFIIII